MPARNRIVVDERSVRSDGLRRCRIEHRYDEGDLGARAELIAMSRRIMRRAGAVGCYVHPIDTFSHAAGTVRMGVDARTAPLDANGRFLGFDNVYVTDASAFPTCAAVNPSLTIAANALRVGAHIGLVAGESGLALALGGVRCRISLTLHKYHC